LYFSNAAEAHESAPARLLCRKPLLPHEAFRLHLDMEPHLLVDVGGDAIATDEDVPIGCDSTGGALHEVDHVASFS
jgi:hypothetical protein